MKKILFVFICAAILLGMASCEKFSVACGEVSSETELGSQIEIHLGGGATKATEITAVPSSLYWGATTGSGTEALQWNTNASTAAAVSSNKINTGKSQPSTPTTYNYYVSNVPLSVGANTTVSASNTTDVVVGRGSSNTTTPSVTLGHIFARVYNLTFEVPSGFTGSEIVWSIVGKSTINGTAGTYNLRTGAWTAASTTLSSYYQMSSATVSQQTASQTVDLYLIPGTYTVKIVFKLTKSGTTKTFTQSGDITIVQGKKNNVTANPATGVGTGIDDDWEGGGTGNL